MKNLQISILFALTLVTGLNTFSRKSEASAESQSTKNTLKFFDHIMCDKGLSGTGQEVKFFTDVNDSSETVETKRSFDVELDCESKKDSILFNIERNFEDKTTQFEDIHLYVKNNKLYSSTFGYIDPVNVIESTDRTIAFTYDFRNPSNTYIEYKMEYRYQIDADGEITFSRIWSNNDTVLTKENFTASP